MISFVQGRIDSLAAETVVVDMAGIGVEVQVTSQARARLRSGETARIPTTLVVREDSFTLFGFVDDDERETFAVLQSVRGIGPRVARSLLSVMTPEQLRAAVAAEDVRSLTRVPGIGPRGAQRMVIDLRDKLPAPDPTHGGAVTPDAPSRPDATWAGEVTAALVGLGWTSSDAGVAVQAVAEAAQPGGAAHHEDRGPDVATLLRMALQTLNQAR